ncbi:fumarate hydrolyase [Coprothermobacteraceae bacterium]|nr:fumarate hydrolyase [Coprothermobacteraceae bacterium]
MVEGYWYEFSGVLTIGRDRGLKQACAEKKPFTEVLFLAGPTLDARGSALGSCGPTSVNRMIPMLHDLRALGVRHVIGKGVNAEVIDAFRSVGLGYGVAVGGAGAFYGLKIRRLIDRSYTELGPEGVFLVEVVDLPFYVVVEGVVRDGITKQVQR